jgi:PAS domain-containing protein
MEREMSTDELAHPGVSGTARRACAASAPQRPRAEERVGQQEQRLAATYQHAGIGIVEVDAQGKLVRVNAQWCALTGYSSDEMLGRSIFDRTDDDEDVKADRERFRRQVAGDLDRYTARGASTERTAAMCGHR